VEAHEGRARIRQPGAVADEEVGEGVDVGWGVDTDGDGRPDTALTGDGADLLVHTDLDGDGLVDRLLRIGPDGSVREVSDGELARIDEVAADPHVAWLGVLGLSGPDT
jgi:hypothetical protein